MTLSRRSFAKRSMAAGAAPLVAGGLTLPRAAAQSSTIQLASNGSNPEPKLRMEEMVKIFEEQNADYKVEINVTEHEAFKQQVRTFLASDSPPDVLTWFAGNRMRFFADNELLLNLDDLYAEQGLEEKFPAGILEVSKGNDGHYYFMPTSYYHWAVYYRPSLFEEAKVEVPETWEDFLAVCDALTGIGKTPLTIGTQAPWTSAAWFDYFNMRTTGPEFHIELMDGKQAYNSQEVKDAFGHWKELLDRDAFIPQPEAYMWQDALTPMVQGDAAMYLMGRFILDSYPDEAEDDLDFFRFPIIDAGVAVGEDAPTDGFFASAKTDNVEGAHALLGYIGSAESQQQQFEMGGSPGVNIEIDPSIFDENTQKGLTMLQESDYIAQFYDRDTHPDMAERGMNAFIEFWNNPDDLDGILDRLDEERKRVYEDEA